MKKKKDFTNTKIKPQILEANTKQESLVSNDSLRNDILLDLENGYKMFEASLKASNDNKVNRPLDYSFADFVNERWGFSKSENGSPDSFYHMLGIDPSTNTIESLYQGMPNDPDTRKWLAPAIIREALREGIAASTLYSEIVKANIGVGGLNVTMPKILDQDANIKATGEGESIVVGTAKFGQKDIKLRKFGYGIEMSYEVLNFVPLNILNTYLEDAGAKFSRGLTTLAIQALLNGDQANGSQSAAVIGVDNTTTGITYRDLLRVWIRMQMRGRRPVGMISGEVQGLNTLMLDEFKKFVIGAPQLNLNIKTPIPETQNMWLNSAIPANSTIILDTNQSIIQLTAMDLMVESEKIVNKQLNGTYATMITGFSNLQRDARVILDGSKLFTAFGFPAFMDLNDNVVM